MKLLIITQKVDCADPILGFFHQWVEEFAKHCESVIVICLQKGEYDLPKNVRVLSLGKEKVKSLKKLTYIFIFFRFIWRERKNYNTIFVHMNPIYAVLGGIVWRMQNKRIGLWYAHKSVDVKLRAAEKMVHVIFTPSMRSFRIESNKKYVVGHGIDTDMFAPAKRPPHTLSLLSVGRIAPVKNYETLISAVKKLANRGISAHARIIGIPITPEDHKYAEQLRFFVRNQGLESLVTFAGAVSQTHVPNEIHDATIFINMSKTGSLDKAVLEAMSCGILILTSNEGFRDILGNDMSIFTFTDESDLADKIIYLQNLSQIEKNTLTARLRATILEKHDLKKLIPNIISHYATS